MKVTLKVCRFNPETDKEPHYDTFTVEAEPNERILDCLNKIRWNKTAASLFACLVPMESAAQTD